MSSEMINKSLQIINGLFSNTVIQEADKQYIGLFKEITHKASSAEKKALSEALLNTTLPHDNPVPLYFLLFDLLNESKFLELLFEFVGNTLPPNIHNELFWSIINRSFTGHKLSNKVTEQLRKHHARTSSRCNASLDALGVRRKKQVSSVKNIAIIAPQILSMGHAPTREAFNISLNLDHSFGCTTYVFNTNSLTYTNELGLLEPLTSHANKELKGGQIKKVDYMQFKQKDVRIISFDPGPLTTGKIATILNTLEQFGIDAVISHGENSLIQEAIYGLFPSLFATTGGVVPFAHSDAYFVPKHLFTTEHQKITENFGHKQNFLLESMLVTPAGKEEGVVNKQEYSIAEDKFVYLVVGTRLKKELCSEFIIICERILDHAPDSVIAFAGTQDLVLKDYFSEKLIESGRLIQLGFQGDLPRVSKMADVYLNPLRQGGGTSSQTAIINDLPIVTRDHGHISAVVPDELRQSTWQSYFDFAIALKEDPELLKQWQNTLSVHFIENLDTHEQISKMYTKLVEVASCEYGV
ncbi:hypothetical protein ACOI22_09985 [Glaciecola sp. 2405UD65-10]|uniref:hypothetical protein n=1 Tax=Glaciecola sp. 2405UD65-10 TaxID=3397244 RepID=UPI003B5A74A8